MKPLYAEPAATEGNTPSLEPHARADASAGTDENDHCHEHVDAGGLAAETSRSDEGEKTNSIGIAMGGEIFLINNWQITGNKASKLKRETMEEPKLHLTTQRAGQVTITVAVAASSPMTRGMQRLLSAKQIWYKK
jgi:hypothetical protein